MKNKPWLVNIFEFERGYGSKLDEVKAFEAYEDALEFVKTHNAQNNKTVVPDWYTKASSPHRNTKYDEELQRTKANEK